MDTFSRAKLQINDFSASCRYTTRFLAYRGRTTKYVIHRPLWRSTGPYPAPFDIHVALEGPLRCLFESLKVVDKRPLQGNILNKLFKNHW